MMQDFLDQIPTNKTLELRFKFIDNEILRSNIAIYLRYVIFLLKFSDIKGSELLSYSLYKNIVVYTASIVESLLEYTINREILMGRVDKKVFGKGERVSTLAAINHECDELEDTNSNLLVVKKTVYLKHGSKDRLNFKDITHAAKMSGILSSLEYEAAENLRKKRNMIHISALTKESDDFFKKKDVEAAFKSANDIIRKIEPLYASKA